MTIKSALPSTAYGMIGEARGSGMLPLSQSLHRHLVSGGGMTFTFLHSSRSMHLASESLLQKTLQEAALTHREVGFFREDDMVENPDPEDPGGVEKLSGDGDVLAAWFWRA